MSSVRTPQQNGVVERRNRTLVEAARIMLIFSRTPLFLWAESIATACFTQNLSIINRHFNKTPYELINGRKPDISFLHVFGALCYPKNDREDIGKLGAKGDIGFFIGYSADSCAYRIYNRRTNKIIETMNVSFDELSVMAFEQRSSKPGHQSMTSGQISFIDADHPSHVYKLKKALYGLNQAPRAWYDEFSRFLLHNHFFKGTIDPTLFIRRFQDDILVDYGYELTGFSDADYTGCKDTFKSTSDRAQFLGYQLADLFTKALPADRFNYLVRRLGMRCLSPQELDRLAKSQ
nr:retrovirus-related Pol polyprotein from transposon TNT 1-94 [Tanacetum cinerariifolium]